MSKIFEALQGTRSEVSALLPALMESEAVAPPAATRLEEVPPPLAMPMEEIAGIAAAATEQAPTQVRRARLMIPASVPVLPFEESGSHASEQYRIARTKIVHHAKKPRLITVTSPSTGDGKTITAINLAGALSLKAASKVLLVDGDFRRSAVHALLGLPRNPGLAEVITGECAFEDAVVEAVEYPNLHILTGGNPKANPSELLETAEWRSFCGMVRARYEYAILDAPPIGSVADSDLIQLAADGIIMVLRPDYTRRGSCTKALEAIPKDKLLGVLLNGMKSFPFGQHEYGYGYGYGPGYTSVPVAGDAGSRRTKSKAENAL